MNCFKTIAITTLVTGALLAQQEFAAAQLVLGAKVGPTFAKVSDADDTVDQSQLTSFGGGGFLRFGTGRIAVQPELLVITKGSKIEDGTSSVEIRLDYVEVPLLLRLGLGSGGFVPYVMAGPALAFEISCDFKGSDTGFDFSGDCDDTDLQLDFERNKMDIGLTGVVGFELKAGPGSFLIEGRYNHGLKNISKDDTTPDSAGKHRVYALFAGYAISLGTR